MFLATERLLSTDDMSLNLWFFVVWSVSCLITIFEFDYISMEIQPFCLANFTSNRMVCASTISCPWHLSLQLIPLMRLTSASRAMTLMSFILVRTSQAASQLSFMYPLFNHEIVMLMWVAVVTVSRPRSLTFQISDSSLMHNTMTLCGSEAALSNNALHLSFQVC